MYNDTELVKFPCPKCGIYHTPVKVIGGYSYMECSSCGRLYKTSNKVSINFRSFCSKIAKKPNRSSTYYTSTESKFKKYLDSIGLKEGIDWWHNVRVCYTINNKRRYYWLDYLFRIIPLAIEINPAVWHKLWNRTKSDKLKEECLKKDNIQLVKLSDKDLKNTESIENKLKEAGVFNIIKGLRWTKIS